MAGGPGSKLWPVSREHTPKQFIQIIGKKTLFQHNVEALLERFSAHDIFVSTSNELIHYVSEQAPQIPKENYIIEPKLGRDTGPASCYAMAKVAHRYPNEVVMFYVQAVCTRNPADRFLDMIETMEELVRTEGKLVTGTQIPKYVETGSDLMKLGSIRAVNRNMTAYSIDGWVDVVKERMTAEQVSALSKLYTLGTHCNHWTWTPTAFFQAVKEHRPDWYQVTQKIINVFGLPDEQEQINTLYSEFEPGRIELMTRELIPQQKVQAVMLPYKWFHITTWDDVYRYYQEQGIDTKQTEVIEVQQNGNLVLSQNKKLVALISVENMVIIETSDSILVCPRDKANKVKEITDQLKTRGYQEYL